MTAKVGDIIAGISGVLPGTLPADGSLINADAYPALARVFSDAGQEGLAQLPFTEAVNGVWGASDYHRATVFSPDGMYLACGHNNYGRLAIRRVNDWSTVDHGIVPTSAVYGIAFSPDSSLMAYCTSAYTDIISTADWSQVVRLTNEFGHQVKGNKIRFSNDGSRVYIAYSSSPYFRAFDTATWAEVAGSNITGHSVISFSESPDGSKIATVSSSAPRIFVYNSADFSAVSFGSSFTIGGTPTDVAFTPDGSVVSVATTSYPYLYQLDASAWTLLPSVNTIGTNSIRSIAYTADGSFLIATTQYGDTYRIYDASSLTLLHSSGGVSSYSCDIHPDGDYAVVGFSGSPGYRVFSNNIVIAGVLQLPDLPALSLGNSQLARPLIRVEEV
ncbi:WD40 repeat domain-containing protein [Marinobacterium iners]|uniref:WD40-like Beta Propeller Repeat n=1 Tax=Marinobacterium iners DSM 11526 TaxID=1122198 RepID=A0A1H3X6M1_9GAMM|nr:hypothetical protein [Marinobacterium iners]SDZ94294.1 hypothetical protein SAMN02745729_10138 [Marinobacterium iners DSM 11526]